MASPSPRGPIDARDALVLVEAGLLALLRTITPEEWDAPTIVPGWRVRHVAAHLLDTASRKLSILRDGFAVERPTSASADDVRQFVNRLNAEGVQVFGRLSVDVLLPIMEVVSAASVAWHRTLDPAAPAGFSVSWAGEATSANWFDTARELTERWHHQAQIRLALGRPPLMDREVYHPVLDTFMRVLPHAYRHLDAEAGTLISVCVDGPAADDWQLVCGKDGWILTGGLDGTPAARLHLPGEIAWRAFTKGIDRAALASRVRVDGEARLIAVALDAVAIVG